jgi:hypothetical protein
MTRRRRRHPGPARLAIATTLAFMTLVTAVTVLHVIGWIAATVAIGAVCWYAGRRSFPRIPRTRTRTPAPANARSLAQLNRHLNERLDAMQVKLEAEMNRADRAEESARAAWDATADQLAAQPMSGARRIGGQR